MTQQPIPRRGYRSFSEYRAAFYPDRDDLESAPVGLGIDVAVLIEALEEAIHEQEHRDALDDSDDAPISDLSEVGLAPDFR